MPQVHNKSVMVDGNALGKNSRYMNTMKFSNATKRRVRAFNYVDNKLTQIRLKYYKRQEEIEYNRIQREREFVLVKLKRMMAYKKVAHDHSISNAEDYQKALNEDRSYRVIQKQIQDMITEISPQYVREKRAREKVDEARKHYDDVITQNRKQLDIIYPAPNVKLPFRAGEDDDLLRSSAPTPKSAPPEMNAEMRMRRLTLPQNKRRTIGISKAFVMEKSNLGEKLEKEKTGIELPAQTVISETARTEPVEIHKSPSELPPIIQRRASIKEGSKKTKQKKTDKPNYDLAPVSLKKTISQHLDIRSD